VKTLLAPLHADLEIAELQALSTVCQTQSLTKAARILGVGIPAISKQLTRLESKLGVKLLHRTTRLVTLSTAGLQLAANFEHAWDVIGQAVDEVRLQQSEVAGKLRVTAPPVIFNNVISPLFCEFVLLNPDVRIELDLSTRITDLASEGFDLALRVANAPPPDCVATELGQIHFGLYASSGYLKRNGLPKKPQDLLGHRFIATRVQRGKSLLQLNNRNSTKSLQLEPVFVTQNAEATLRLISADIGIGALPDYLAKTQPFLTKLKRVLPAWTASSEWGTKLFALTLPGRSTRSVARGLIQMLRSRNGGLEVV
jgi:DNA-binding transcriptional LysR family regulator